MEDQFQAQAPKVEQATSVKEMLFKYVRFLPFIVISLSFALLAAFLYLRYTSPTFRADGVLVVKTDNGGGASGGSNTSGDRFQQMFVMDNSINIKNEIEIIRSRQLIRRVVDNLKLNVTYMVKGKIKESNVYTSSPIQFEVLEIGDSSTKFDLEVEVVNERTFRLGDNSKVFAFGQNFENDLGVFRINYNRISSLSDNYRIIWQSPDEAVNDIAKNLVVAPGAAAGIIQISLESTNPQQGADIINDLMKEYQVATREDKNETNRRMLVFIDSRLKDVGRELDSITGRYLAYQRANNIIGDVESQSSGYISRLEATEEQINELRVETDMAITLDAYLRDRKNAYNLVPSTFGLKDGTLNNLIAAYNVAQLERKALIDANVPVTNPAVKQYEDQIERLRISALESLRNLRNNIGSSVSRLTEMNNRIRSQISTLPLKEQNLMEIKTQQEAKQTVVNLLLEKREQTAIALAGTISNMKVIEEARPNTVPVKPDRKTIYMMALLGGLAIPALFIFIGEMLNDKVNSRYDVEKATTVPIAGEIGHSFGKEPLVVKPNNRGLVAEQFRIIRSNLQYLLHNVDKPVVLITSSFSGEGKSYVSTNLGAVLSLANKRTIILEFDIRKPKILSHLNMPKKPGIINFLLGKAEIKDLPVNVPGYEHLFVLPCGPVPPNPSELLLDPKLDDLFAYLKTHFDTIIIDTAPIGMVSDAMTLSRFADNTLYVVRQGYTYKKQIGLIEDYHVNGKMPRMSILINDVKARMGYGYYGYGKYGYGYGEKSGYFEEEKQPKTLMNKWFGWLDTKKWDKQKTKV